MYTYIYVYIHVYNIYIYIATSKMMYTMYNQMQQNMLSVRVFLNLLGLQEIHGAQ
jgi:hypothetical protein